MEICVWRQGSVWTRDNLYTSFKLKTSLVSAAFGNEQINLRTQMQTYCQNHTHRWWRRRRRLINHFLAAEWHFFWYRSQKKERFPTLHRWAKFKVINAADENEAASSGSLFITLCKWGVSEAALKLNDDVFVIIKETGIWSSSRLIVHVEKNSQLCCVHRKIKCQGNQ